MSDSFSFSGSRHTPAAWIVALTLVIAVGAIEVTALLALLMSGLIVVLASRSCNGPRGWQDGLSALLAIQFVTVVLYLAHYLILPNLLGFTGPGALGTDDNFFYSQIAPYVPRDFPLRADYYGVVYDFSLAYRQLLAVFIALFGVFHPLQLLVFNATGLALSAVFVLGLARHLRLSQRQRRLVFWLALLCPFSLANSVVLLREGWLAAAFSMSLYGFVAKRPVYIVAALAIAYIMRLESAVLLAGNIGLMLFFLINSRPEVTADGIVRRPEFRGGRVALQAAAAAVLLGVVVLLGQQLLPLMGKAALGRPEFVETFIRSISEREGGTSTLYTISTLPLYASLPLGLLFFAGAPFLALNLIVIDDTFIPRYLLQNVFAVEMIFLLPLFLRGCLQVLREKDALLIGLLAVFIIDTLLISQFSLQLRHKVMLMPAFYLLCVVGLAYPVNRVAQWTLAPSAFLVLLSGAIMLSNLDVL